MCDAEEDEWHASFARVQTESQSAAAGSREVDEWEDLMQQPGAAGESSSSQAHQATSGPGARRPAATWGSSVLREHLRDFAGPGPEEVPAPARTARTAKALLALRAKAAERAAVRTQLLDCILYVSFCDVSVGILGLSLTV